MDLVTYALLKNKITETINANLYDDTEIQNKVSEIKSQLATLVGSGDGSVSKQISNAISSLVDGAPDTLDTLKEISDWIDAHGDIVININTKIQDNTEAINAVKLDMNNKLDNSGYASDKYIGTDAEGNIIEKDAPSFTGTPSVNDSGILIFAPDVAATVNNDGVLII